MDTIGHYKKGNMKRQKSREEKIKALKHLMTGQTTIKDFAPSVHGFVMVRGDKVFAHTYKGVHERFDRPMDFDHWKREYKCDSLHIVILEDYSRRHT